MWKPSVQVIGVVLIFPSENFDLLLLIYFEHETWNIEKQFKVPLKFEDQRKGGIDCEHSEIAGYWLK